MSIQQPYVSTFPPKKLYQPEARLVARLKLRGVQDQHMVEVIRNGNLIQMNSRSQAGRVVSSIVRRLRVLDPHLLEILAHGPLESARIVNIYAIMKTDRLFREFMVEVYLPQARLAEGAITPSDVRRFMVKAEQSDTVASWSAYLMKRLGSILLQTITEAGLTTGVRERQIRRVILDRDLTNHLIELGDASYVSIITGRDA